MKQLRKSVILYICKEERAVIYRQGISSTGPEWALRISVVELDDLPFQFGISVDSLRIIDKDIGT